jgi:hypothetical protein
LRLATFRIPTRLDVFQRNSGFGVLRLFRCFAFHGSSSFLFVVGPNPDAARRRGFISRFEHRTVSSIEFSRGSCGSRLAVIRAIALKYKTLRSELRYARAALRILSRLDILQPGDGFGSTWTSGCFCFHGEAFSFICESMEFVGLDRRFSLSR